MTNLPPGTLKVLIHSAKHLASLVTLGEQQPYYVIECGFQKIRSKPCLESGTDPVWKTAHKFELIRETTITITLKDEITKGVIGEADVDLREVRTAGREDISMYLKTLGGKQQGVLNLKLRFAPAEGYELPGGPASPSSNSQQQEPSAPPTKEAPLQQQEQQEQATAADKQHSSATTFFRSASWDANAPDIAGDGVTASRISFARNRAHRPPLQSGQQPQRPAIPRPPGAEEEVPKGDPSAMLAAGFAAEPSGASATSAADSTACGAPEPFDSMAASRGMTKRPSFSAAAALAALSSEMSTGREFAAAMEAMQEDLQQQQQQQAAANGLSSSRAGSGSADLVQDLIERNSRAAEELSGLRVMVEEQAAALKQKNAALAQAQAALSEARQDQAGMEEELSVLRHQVEALGAAHRSAQLEAQQMVERNAALARQLGERGGGSSGGASAQALVEQQAGEIARLKHELEERRTTCEVLQRQVAKGQVDMQMLQDQVAELEGEKASLESQAQALQLEVASLREQLGSSDRERQELEEALGLMEQSSQEQIQELEAALAQARSEAEAAAAKHEEELQAHSEAEEMQYLQQQLRRSYQQVLQLQQQVSDLQAAPQAAGAASAEAAAELAAAKAKISQLELAAAKQQLELAADLEQLLADKERLVQEQERLHNEREELMTELVSTKLELAETREREIVMQRTLNKQSSVA